MDSSKFIVNIAIKLVLITITLAINLLSPNKRPFSLKFIFLSPPIGKMNKSEKQELALLELKFLKYHLLYMQDLADNMNNFYLKDYNLILMCAEYK